MIPSATPKTIKLPAEARIVYEDAELANLIKAVCKPANTKVVKGRLAHNIPVSISSNLRANLATSPVDGPAKQF
jgi:hypothetical protein